ncbi:MAG: hypothetical protein ACJ8R9_19345 [Steroidobacteraceae bacterium]
MSKSKPDPWHFARPELAQKYLQTFEIGLISAQALFAPRRMGKSEFLEQDLIPAAQKSGLLTAYLNLWDAREHPRGALLVHWRAPPRRVDSLRYSRSSGLR